MAENTKRVILHEDETKPYRAGHYVSLRDMGRNVIVRGLCCDCGLQTTQTVNELVQDSTIAMATVSDLEELISCSRESCRGDMFFDVDEATAANMM